MVDDETPEGDPIDTRTFWLSFPEGDVAISADLTKWNAAMRRIRRASAQRDGGQQEPDDEQR